MNVRAEPPPPKRNPHEQVLLYQSAAKIQPRSIWDRYAKLRVAAMATLLGLYYGLPWVTLGGHPAVWFDLPARRFHILTLTLVPQDLILLTGLLLIAALTLFLFTTLGGRLWCGYACPQTVWTEAFLWMEQLCEGDRYDRMKLDRAPLSTHKALRRGGKHVLWAGFSLYTGLTFVAYFVPAREVFGDIVHGNLVGWPMFWAVFYGFATWGNAGFMREQVCKYMCPYARFQSAMFDRDTLIIAYDEKRGEPRKSTAKKEGKTAGDCIDCSLCVQVCPVGIDIRKGLQYECIACAACVDACNTVMDSVHKPRGLIRYTSARHDVSGKFNILRPRVLGYGLAWMIAIIGFLVLLAHHTLVRVDVLRDRHALYREHADGAIENLYILKVTNEDSVPHRFAIKARFGDGTPLTAEPASIDVQTSETKAATISLSTPPRPAGAAPLPMVEDVSIELEAEDDSHIEHTRAARFLTGGNR